MFCTASSFYVCMLPCTFLFYVFTSPSPLTLACIPEPFFLLQPESCCKTLTFLSTGVLLLYDGAQKQWRSRHGSSAATPRQVEDNSCSCHCGQSRCRLHRGEEGPDPQGCRRAKSGQGTNPQHAAERSSSSSESCQSGEDGSHPWEEDDRESPQQACQKAAEKDDRLFGPVSVLPAGTDTKVKPEVLHMIESCVPTPRQ